MQICTQTGRSPMKQKRQPGTICMLADIRSRSRLSCTGPTYLVGPRVEHHVEVYVCVWLRNALGIGRTCQLVYGGNRVKEFVNIERMLLVI